MNHFQTEKSLKAHEEHCNTNECIKINMPEKGSGVFFKELWKSQRVPFIFYADTESLNHYKVANQIQKPDTHTNIKSTSQLAFPIILSALMIMY